MATILSNLLDGLENLEARDPNGNGNNTASGGFGAIGQTFVRIADNSYTDGTELMARARPLEWDPEPVTTDVGLINPATQQIIPGPVFPNNPDDEIPQGRRGADTPFDANGNLLPNRQVRIPLTDDLRFVNQPTGELPQARDISEAVFNQDLDGDGDDEDLPTPFGTNDFHLFFGQALTHDMVETQVNVDAVSIPGETGIGWAGGTVDADGNPTAATLVRVDPATGQVLRDGSGAPIIVPVSLDDLESPPQGGLPAASGYPAISVEQLEAAHDAYVNHQALSLGAPFALQRTPGVYDDDGVRQQANTETAFLDLGNVYGKETTAVVQKDAIGTSTFVSIVEGSEFVEDGIELVTIEVDTTNLLRKLDANGQPTAYLLTSDDVVDPNPSDDVDLDRDGFNLLPTYREVNVNQNVFVDDPDTAMTDEAEVSMGAVFDPTLANFFDLDRFAAGDQRVNQNIATVTQQTVWMRNHNEWVDIVSETVADDGWSSHQIFEVARALNEAEYQKAVYDEYLPVLIGEDGMAMLGEYEGYEPKVNPAIINEWTTIAFRFGHDQSSNFVESLMEDGAVAERVPLIESFTRAGDGAQASVPTPSAMDEWLRGQLSAAHQAIDGYVVKGNRGELFGVTISPVTGQPVINDLTVFDTVRGRDHGVNSYVKLREALGLDTYTAGGTGEDAFDAWAADNPTLVTEERLAAIKELYGNDFTKLDAYVGVLLEEKYGDSQLGVTSTMLVAMQFAATRDGDRFWYENRFEDHPELLALVEESSMATIVERTSGVEHAYRHAFLAHEREGGTDGDDNFAGTDGRDLLIGFAGDDRLVGQEGDDDLHGGDGDDILLAGLGNDSVDGGNGEDRLVAEGEGAFITGINPWSETGQALGLGTGEGIGMGEAGFALSVGGTHAYADVNDEGIVNALEAASIAVNVERIDGTGGRDTFQGRNANDLFFGRGGNDYVVGRSGDDDLFGGDGNDRLLGEAGDDVLNGDAGEDTLEGGDGDDVLRDGGESDVMLGGAGDDTFRLLGTFAEIDGGEGYDHVVGRFSDVALDLDLAESSFEQATGSSHGDQLDAEEMTTAVQIDGLEGNDSLYGGAAGDRLAGSLGSDLLKGGGGDDRIHGGEGGDELVGDGGDDTLLGEAGDDLLRGRDGDDVLIGGEGADVFSFDDRDNNNNGGETPVDVIRDFEFGIDTATFRFDGGWFSESGIETRSNGNTAEFSTVEDFYLFLTQTEMNGGSIDVRGDDITANVLNGANGRTLGYQFQDLDQMVIDGWLESLA